ncbi:hypothetical protein FQA39_LY12086 [Lamprigera yunnana]|nr:hypothetical protein FQA39_LY12086 [Lamprigera yunnana]
MRMDVRRNRYLEYAEEQRMNDYVSAVVLERDKIRKKSKYDHLHRCLNERRKEAEQQARLENKKERANYLEFVNNQEQQLEIQLREVKTSELCEKKER